jgi:pyruvate,water dikinase
VLTASSAISLPEEVTSLLRPLASIPAPGKPGRGVDPRAARFGGKATALADLARAGLPVPTGWVLDASYFRRFVDQHLPKGHEVASLIKTADTRVGMDRAARARDRILSDPLPEDLSTALERLYEAVGPGAPWGLSVRSSATVEDARGSSLAGLATTVLGVRGAPQLFDAIRQVWASLYLPRTLIYLSRWGVREVAMPILFMPMVQAVAAGVIFTGPPPGLEGERWKRDERVVHATFGLGAPVVDGASAIDTFRLSAQGALIDSVIAAKTTELVVDAGGLVVRRVEPERQSLPALGEATILELGALAKRLTAGRPEPLDVEFAIERGPDGVDRLFILQARPVTGGLFPESGVEDTVWSRANVGEALPGAATPLTWSVARRFSDDGFRAAFAALGCRVPKDAVLVANVYGRFYLNLSAFMDIAAQVPGLSPRALLEQSGGAPIAIIEQLEARARDVNKRGFLFRAPFVAPGLLMRHVRLEREVTAWEADAERQRKRLADLDLALLPDDALAQTLTGASDLLFTAGELMLTCASASLATHLGLTSLLSSVVRRKDAHGDELARPEVRREAARIAQALTGGIAEIESANPGLALLRVANLARKEPDALAAITAGARSPAELPPGPTRGALLEFLEAFGDRAVREAELMTPRWREDPSALMAMLTAALRGPPVDPDAGPARARAFADREMARLESMTNVAETRATSLLVGRMQAYTRLRERMRAWVTRTLGMIRTVALEIDKRFLHLEPTLEPGSVFFCTFDELVHALRAGGAYLSHIIRLRRAEFLRDAARPDPPSTFVGRPPPVTLPPSAGHRLTGLAASPGVVEGPARVVAPGEDAASVLQPGEILVARTTDVGMSPLFLLAVGVVTELGGPLSHAAIVAREYNVPTVVNVEGATLSIRSGERLRVDGDRGVVEKLDSPPRPVSLAGHDGD